MTCKTQSATREHRRSVTHAMSSLRHETGESRPLAFIRRRWLWKHRESKGGPSRKGYCRKTMALLVEQANVGLQVPGVAVVKRGGTFNFRHMECVQDIGCRARQEAGNGVVLDGMNTLGILGQGSSIGDIGAARRSRRSRRRRAQHIDDLFVQFHNLL